MHYKALVDAAFTKTTFMQFLRALHNKVRKPFAVLWDNASYHGKEGGEVETYCRRNEILIIRNVPYRPDFNGIEGYWALVKRSFRSRLDWLKANGLTWNLLQLVEDCLCSIPEEKVVKYTRVGFECIRAGKPVEPRRWREGPNHNLYLGDLTPLLRPNAQTRRQWEKHKAEMLAEAETTDPGRAEEEAGEEEEGEEEQEEGHD